MTIAFEVFNKQTLPSSSLSELSEIATVSLRTDGVFAFSNAAVKLLKLKEGTLLGFYRDPRHKDWYICLNDPNGYPVRVTTPHRKKTKEKARFALSHRELSRRIRADINREGLLVIPIGETQADELYPLNSRQIKVRAARVLPARSGNKK